MDLEMDMDVEQAFPPLGKVIMDTGLPLGEAPEMGMELDPEMEADPDMDLGSIQTIECPSI